MASKNPYRKCDVCYSHGWPRCDRLVELVASLCWVIDGAQVLDNALFNGLLSFKVVTGCAVELVGDPLGLR